MEVAIGANLRGGISPKRPKRNFGITYLHLFVELERKLRKIYVVAFHFLSYIAFCGSRVRVMLNLGGGISPQTPEMYI